MIFHIRGWRHLNQLSVAFVAYRGIWSLAVQLIFGGHANGKYLCLVDNDVYVLA